jgi:hypothetical protein
VNDIIVKKTRAKYMSIAKFWKNDISNNNDQLPAITEMADDILNALEVSSLSAISFEIFSNILHG